tara:strand:+ start:87 stop:269 length:183 start_codon:yes stop_codon:yes gene_type:complete
MNRCGFDQERYVGRGWCDWSEVEGVDVETREEGITFLCEREKVYSRDEVREGLGLRNGIR